MYMMANSSLDNISISVLKLDPQTERILRDNDVTTLNQLSDRIRLEQLHSEDDNGIPSIGDRREFEIKSKFNDFKHSFLSPFVDSKSNTISVGATLAATFIAVFTTGKNFGADEIQAILWVGIGLLAFEYGRWVGVTALKLRPLISVLFLSAAMAFAVLSHDDNLSHPAFTRAWGVPLWVLFDVVCLFLGAQSGIPSRDRVFWLRKLPQPGLIRSGIAVIGTALTLIAVCDQPGLGEVFRIASLLVLLLMWHTAGQWAINEKLMTFRNDTVVGESKPAILPAEKSVWERLSGIMCDLAGEIGRFLKSLCRSKEIRAAVIALIVSWIGAAHMSQRDSNGQSTQSQTTLPK
jgi:hypothetical protein